MKIFVLDVLLNLLAACASQQQNIPLTEIKPDFVEEISHGEIPTYHQPAMDATFNDRQRPLPGREHREYALPKSRVGRKLQS